MLNQGNLLKLEQHFGYFRSSKLSIRVFNKSPKKFFDVKASLFNWNFVWTGWINACKALRRKKLKFFILFWFFNAIFLKHHAYKWNRYHSQLRYRIHVSFWCSMYISNQWKPCLNFGTNYRSTRFWCIIFFEFIAVFVIDSHTIF